MSSDGSRQEILLVTFEGVTETFRKRVISWLQTQFKELVQKVRWRDGANQNTLMVKIMCEELAFALTAVKEAIKRRALFK
jgi:hypothetical protein